MYGRYLATSYRLTVDFCNSLQVSFETTHAPRCVSHCHINKHPWRGDQLSCVCVSYRHAVYGESRRGAGHCKRYVTLILQYLYPGQVYMETLSLAHYHIIIIHQVVQDLGLCDISIISCIAIIPLLTRYDICSLLSR